MLAGFGCKGRKIKKQGSRAIYPPDGYSGLNSPEFRGFYKKVGSKKPKSPHPGHLLKQREFPFS